MKKSFLVISLSSSFLASAMDKPSGEQIHVVTSYRVAMCFDLLWMLDDGCKTHRIDPNKKERYKKAIESKTVFVYIKDNTPMGAQQLLIAKNPEECLRAFSCVGKPTHCCKILSQVGGPLFIPDMPDMDSREFKEDDMLLGYACLKIAPEAPTISIMQLRNYALSTFVQRLKNKRPRYLHFLYQVNSHEEPLFANSTDPHSTTNEADKFYKWLQESNEQNRMISSFFHFIGDIDKGVQPKVIIARYPAMSHSFSQSLEEQSSPSATYMLQYCFKKKEELKLSVMRDYGILKKLAS